MCVCVRACELSSVRLFATSGTVAHLAPQSMVFYKQEYWRELLFLSPGDIPNPRIEPAFLVSPASGRQILYYCTSWEA